MLYFVVVVVVVVVVVGVVVGVVFVVVFVVGVVVDFFYVDNALYAYTAVECIVGAAMGTQVDLRRRVCKRDSEILQKRSG